MKRIIVIVLCIGAVASCGVTIAPAERPFDSVPTPQFVAETFWYLNNNALPKARMLRKAARFCDQPSSDLVSSGPYGLHGSWFLNFSCVGSVE